MPKTKTDNETGKKALRTPSESESPRRSTGAKPVENGTPGSAYYADGKPNLSPEAGYAGHEPVQYSDETEAQFQARVDMFESARANAGGLMSQDSADRQLERLKEKYDADVAAIEAKTVK